MEWETATAPSGATLAYQWRRNGLALPDATTATYSKSSATRLDADFYDVVVYSDLTPLVESSAQSGDVSAMALQFAQPDAIARQITPSGDRKSVV